MSRSILVVAGVVVALVPRAGVAQQADSSRNYDFQKPLYTVVDVASKTYFGGWSGDCNSGRAPIAVTLWRTDPATHATVHVPATLTYGPRPDAAAWLAATCVRPFDQTIGWSLVPTSPEPPGEFQYVVLVTDVPTSWTCGVYPVGYPDAGQFWCAYAANAVYRTVK